MYKAAISKYDSSDAQLFPRLFNVLTEDMERNMDQDFLGHMYMACELGNDHAGQFFTPYSICSMMAEMAIEEAEDKLRREGYVAVNDPACGAGALLVAFANGCRARGLDFQNRILFTGQDLDYVVGCMCYIQLSLLGCAGYVTIGDTLAHPQTTIDRKGLFPADEGNVWYTPMFFSDVWHWRRAWTKADLVVAGVLPGSGAEKAIPSAAPEREYGEIFVGQLTLF